MDFIDDTYIEAVFTFDESTESKYESITLDQGVKLGYETHNALLNLKTVGILIIIWHIKIAIYPCLGKAWCKDSKCGLYVKMWQFTWYN